MSTKLFKFTFVLLLLTGILSACSKNNEEMSVLDDYSKILGKWKLLKTTHPITGQSFDYSIDNIVFEFKTNGTLTVSGNIDDLWPSNGDHIYSVSKLINEYNLNQLNLIIDTWPFLPRVSSKNLQIHKFGYSPNDGLVFDLMKIR